MGLFCLVEHVEHISNTNGRATQHTRCEICAIGSNFASACHWKSVFLAVSSLGSEHIYTFSPNLWLSVQKMVH